MREQVEFACRRRPKAWAHPMPSSRQLVIEGFGNYVGSTNTDYCIRRKDSSQRMAPHSNVRELIVPTGNTVSTKALAWASIYNAKVLITSQVGRPLGVVVPIGYDNKAHIRIEQYRAYDDKRGATIAKTLVKSKLEAQASLLRKHGSDLNLDIFVRRLEKISAHSDNDNLRRNLLGIEGFTTKLYKKELAKLLPKTLRFEFQESYKSLYPMNNVFNLAYEVLNWQLWSSCLDAGLDPYVGFMHTIRHGRPSLICDLIEPYGPMIDDFLLMITRELGSSDTIVRMEYGKPRIFLNHRASSTLVSNVKSLLNWAVKKPRRRGYGFKARIITVIDDDIHALAVYMLKEKDEWTPTNVLELQRFYLDP